MVPPINIDEATDSEREWCARLMAASDPWRALGRTLDQCRSTCCRPEYLLLVARDAGGPRGFILLHPRGLAGSPYVASVAVAEDWRDRGIGTLLLKRAEAIYTGYARNIFLCVSSFNQRARRLYERHGYTLVGELDDYVIQGASEFLMRKRLAAK